MPVLQLHTMVAQAGSHMSLEVMLTYNCNFTVARVSKVERGSHTARWVRIRVNRTCIHCLKLLVWQMQCLKPRVTRHQPRYGYCTVYVRQWGGVYSWHKTSASSLRSLNSPFSCYQGLFWLELQRGGVPITALNLNVLSELYLSV